jgi:hypothetical protein
MINCNENNRSIRFATFRTHDLIYWNSNNRLIYAISIDLLREWSSWMGRSMLWAVTTDSPYSTVWRW